MKIIITLWYHCKLGMKLEKEGHLEIQCLVRLSKNAKNYPGRVLTVSAEHPGCVLVSIVHKDHMLLQLKHVEITYY